MPRTGGLCGLPSKVLTVFLVEPTSVDALFGAGILFLIKVAELSYDRPLIKTNVSMKSTFQKLPDPEIGLRDARDFLVCNSLARKAFTNRTKHLPNFVSDLVEAIYRLVQSCHLPEFTDHGLPHLCSLVDRICRWELGPTRKNSILVEELTASEAEILLLATLIHDIGMLSQNPIDLPEDASQEKQKPNWADVANWVRVTHVDRMEKLVRRIMTDSNYENLLRSQLFSNAVAVAASHQQWPWQWAGDWTKKRRLRGLAAIVAVADLLDEDSARCDTTTLLEHREGNQLNKAHWLRHALTVNRILVIAGQIEVDMVRPPDTGIEMRPVFSAIRNHFRLVMLYENDLSTLNAEISNIDLQPSTGIPKSESSLLENWETIHGFGNSSAICFQLLRTFMPEALKDSNRYNAESNEKLKQISLEDVDYRQLSVSRAMEEPRTELEQNFHAFDFGATREQE